LSGDEFDHLLRWLDSDPERAGERYKKLHRKLTEFLGHRDCTCPEDLADRTLDRVARRLAEGEAIRAEEPMAYCLGVARNVRREYWRSPERKNESLEGLPPHENSAIEAFAALPAKEDPGEIDRRLECLTECLNRLSPESRAFIEDYYRDNWHTQIENRKRMAERLGLKHTGLRARAHRIRRELEECVKACSKRDK